MSMFQLSGIASGIDSKSMIEQLMALERQPVLKLRTRQESYKSKNTAYQSVKAMMASLATKVESLSKLETASSRTITSSDATILGGSVSQAAALGTYQITVKQLATATTASSSASNGAAVTSGTLLTALRPANGAALSAGTFTIGGAKFTINRTDATLGHVIAAINSAAGLGDQGDYDSDFVSYDLSAGNTGLSDTAASLDASGRLRLTGVGTTVIGSGRDSSNFLSQIAGLTTGSLSGGDLTGHRLSVAQTAKKLSDGATAMNLQNAGIMGASGSFQINNATIEWTSDDSIDSIIKKINDSTAGVSATYNSIDDKLVLTNKGMGSTAISISNDSGRFLEALGVTASMTQALGKNSEIVVDGINGGAPIARTSNTITDVISGLTLNLAKVDLDKPVTITIGESMGGALNAVNDVVSEFNKLVTELDKLVAKGGRLQYDPSLQQLRQTLTSIMTSPVAGVIGHPNSMIDLGLNSGAIGTGSGATSYSLDQEKLKKALEENPSRVLELLGKKTNGQPQGIMAKLDAYIDEAIGSTGLFASKDAFTVNQNKIIDKQIAAMEARAAKKRETMEKRFLTMETTIAKMNAQRDRLMSQLASLQGGMGLF